MITFPSNPSVNDTYTASGKTWKWTGVVWQLQPRVLTSADITDFAAAVGNAAPPTTDASLLTSGTLADARLSAEVTASLGLADTALQSGAPISDIDGLQTALDGKATSAQGALADTALQSGAPISDIDGLQAALDGKQPSGDYATLENGLVPSSQLPSYVDDVIESANFAALPATGETGKIYVTLDTGKAYRWGGSAYFEIVAQPGSTDAVPEGSTNLYHTTQRAADAAPVQSVAGKTGQVTLEAADISGLSAVATGGSYNDLADLPSLGTAASYNAEDFATSGQGSLADTALQPGTAISNISGLQSALDLKERITHFSDTAPSHIPGRLWIDTTNLRQYRSYGGLWVEMCGDGTGDSTSGGGGGSSTLLDGLLAFYNLSDLTDASENGNTLTNNGGVTFSAGKIGNAANGGSGSQYFTIPDLTVGGLTALTVTFWTNHQDKTGGDFLDEVFGTWYGGSNPFLISYGGIGQYEDPAVQANTLGVVLKTSSGMKFHWDTTPRTTSAWRFIAVKFVADDAVSIKINNESWLTSSVTGGALSAQSQPVRLLDGGDGQGLRSPSQIDAVGIWNRALTEAEVTELYNAGAGKEHPFA